MTVSVVEVRPASSRPRESTLQPATRHDVPNTLRPTTRHHHQPVSALSCFVFQSSVRKAQSIEPWTYSLQESSETYLKIQISLPRLWLSRTGNRERLLLNNNVKTSYDAIENNRRSNVDHLRKQRVMLGKATAVVLGSIWCVNFSRVEGGIEHVAHLGLHPCLVQVRPRPLQLHRGRHHV